MLYKKLFLSVSLISSGLILAEEDTCVAGSCTESNVTNIFDPNAGMDVMKENFLKNVNSCEGLSEVEKKELSEYIDKVTNLISKFNGDIKALEDSHKEALTKFQKLAFEKQAKN